MERTTNNTKATTKYPTEKWKTAPDKFKILYSYIGMTFDVEDDEFQELSRLVDDILDDYMKLLKGDNL